MVKSAVWLSFVVVVSILSAVFSFKSNAFPTARFGGSLSRPVPQFMATSSGDKPYFPDNPRVSLLTEISDRPGSLYDVLKYFWKYDINLTNIESRPTPNKKGEKEVFNIYIDFDGKIGEKKTDNLLEALKQHTTNTLILSDKEVPWFPHHISELDQLSDRTLDAGAELEADHPGFNDPVYRKRRQELADISMTHEYGKEVPYIKYTPEETKTWGIVYDKLKSLQTKYACDEYNQVMPLMEKHCGYSVNNIPQVADISRFLKERTGFQMRPVTGLLSSRDFLSGLAFRMFFSTQYIRHSSRPLYTPEPDICHELLGHAPMFADQDFADFSQEIGLASLGASDEDVKKLATCYWFSVEFGVLKAKDGKGVRAYGAGLLSSFGELEYACSGKEIFGDENAPQPKPTLLPWDPKVAADTPYPICTYQPTLFVAESLADAKNKMRAYCEQMQKPFHAKMNPITNTVWVSRAVKTETPSFEKHGGSSDYYKNNK